MKLANASIAITGATGFLGGYLVTQLLAARAHVVAVVRNPDKARSLAAQGVEVRRADLAEPSALTAAFGGCDAVISNAAVISFTSPRETHRTNVEGTRNVFEACAAAGVTRAVAISSTAAYPSRFRTTDEAMALRRGDPRSIVSAYGESKAAAERLAWRLCNEHGIQLTAFRPCGITGPHDPLLMARIRQFMALWVSPFPVLTQIGVVHAADVARAVCTALERPEVSVGKAYNLQGNTVSLWKLADAYRRAAGKGPRLRVPVLAPARLAYDDSLARRELDFQPRDIHAICEEAVRHA